MRNLFFVSIIAFFLASCDKENTADRPLSQTEIWDCYQSSEWTKTTITDALIGKWKWIYTESFWSPDKGVNTENEKMVIEFLSDSTLNILVDDKLEGTTDWTIAPKDEELFEIELDSAITSLLHGRILMCGEILECNNSYVDGSDNYFEKVD